MGELPHPHKIVINGNHENNAPWKGEVREILSNATVLIGASYEVHWNGHRVKFYGTDFFWPMANGASNPNFKDIDGDTDVLLCHGPVMGYVDGSHGCEDLAKRCGELNRCGRLRLVISGHIHSAYGITEGRNDCSEVQFVNASSCGQDRKVVNSPIVIRI